jgi:hypothetical protein
MSVIRIVRNLSVLAILLVGGLSLRPGWAVGRQSLCKPHQVFCFGYGCCPVGDTCCYNGLGGGHCVHGNRCLP